MQTDMSPSHSEIYLSSILIPSSNIGNSLSRNKAFVKQTHLHIASYTLHILSYTFYLTRCILHIASYTLHLTHCILHIVTWFWSTFQEMYFGPFHTGNNCPCDICAGYKIQNSPNQLTLELLLWLCFPFLLM